MTTTKNFEIAAGGEVNGTFLQGYLTANYKDIKTLLGKPDCESDGYKTDAEWIVTINGKVLTIYNYKDGKNYNGASGKAKTKITNWHIGGRTDISKEAEFLADKVNGSFRSA